MAFPQIDTPSAGPLTAADLDRNNTGRIWNTHRVYAPFPDTLQYDQPDAAESYRREWMAAEACTELGADFKDDWPAWLMTPRTTVVLLLTTGAPLVAVIVWALVSFLPAT